MSIECIAFADHHSGGGYRSRGIDDSQHSMAQIVTIADREKPDWVLSLGDAVNSAVSDANGPIPLRNQLAEILGFGCKIGYIDGNHDKRGTSWLSSPRFVHLHERQIEFGGRRWLGFDWLSRDKVVEAFAKIPANCTGLLMHQAWGELMGFEDAPQCEVAQVPKKITAILTGDYHGNCLIRKFRGEGGQEVTLANPGSTSIQNILEPEDKYVFTIDDKGKIGKVKLRTRVRLESDVLHTIDDLNEFVAESDRLMNGAVEEAIMRQLPPSMHMPLLHVRYSSTLPDVVRRVEKAYLGRAHLFWKEIRPEKVETEDKKVVRNERGLAFTPLTILPKVLRTDDPEDKLAKDVYALAERLLHTSDKGGVAVEVNKWRQEMLGVETEEVTSGDAS